MRIGLFKNTTDICNCFFFSTESEIILTLKNLIVYNLDLLFYFVFPCRKTTRPLGTTLIQCFGLLDAMVRCPSVNHRRAVLFQR